MKNKYPPLSLEDAMPYGQYRKKKTIEQVIDEDPKYMKYCCEELELQLDNEAWEYLQENGIPE